MFELDNCIAFITNTVSKKIAEAFEKKLTDYKITRTQWIALYFINKNKMITQRELSDKLSLKEPTVARLLDKMEYWGWLVRISSEKDKRKKLLRLTQQGKKIEAEISIVAEQFRDDLIKGISNKDLAIYDSVLNRMLKNI